jgi:hypothetical protein
MHEREHTHVKREVATSFRQPAPAHVCCSVVDFRVPPPPKLPIYLTLPRANQQFTPRRLKFTAKSICHVRVHPRVEGSTYQIVTTDLKGIPPFQDLFGWCLAIDPLSIPGPLTSRHGQLRHGSIVHVLWKYGVGWQAVSLAGVISLLIRACCQLISDVAAFQWERYLYDRYARRGHAG